MVKLEHIYKCFSGEETAAVKDVSLDIKEGEFLTILGPSGCGKTTTLRIIAGFEHADKGRVLIDDKDMLGMEPYQRNVNTVFQNYALFPHMNVFDNVAFGLTIKKLSKSEINKKVSEILKVVQMDGFETRMPDQMSGGQKQRVAIARAIINSPKVLLLDEPLGALDLKLRKQMQLELKHLQKKLGITFVFVTHDQEEALTMSDRICVMSKGRIEQLGTPQEIYEKPTTKFVADFIGETNILEANVVERSGNKFLVKIGDGDVFSLTDTNNCPDNGDRTVSFAIRPEKLKIKATPDNGDCFLKASYKERTYVGSSLHTILTLQDGKEVIVNEPSGEGYNFASTNSAYITWHTDNAVVIE